MMSRFLLGFLVVFGLLIGLISGAPTLTPAPGKTVRDNSLLGPGYEVEINRNLRGTLWTFSVYSDGFDGTHGETTPPDCNQNEPKDRPLDWFRVDTTTGTLIIESVWNQFDKTPNRLRLRQILHACWLKTGLEESQLKTVHGRMIQNKNMVDAVKFCRKDLGVGGDFKVTPDAKGKKCWDRLDKTDFSGVIKAGLADFGLSKRLVEIELVRYWCGDNVKYTFE